MYDGCSNFGTNVKTMDAQNLAKNCTVDTETLNVFFKSVQSPNAQKEDAPELVILLYFSQSVCFFHFEVKKIHNGYY